MLFLLLFLLRFADDEQTGKKNENEREKDRLKVEP
jgi:hypothetical protein